MAVAEDHEALTTDVIRDENANERELRASRAADRQGLTLRKSGGREPCRYGLFYARYNQPVAKDLELEAVEGWLGLSRVKKRARRAGD